MAEEAFGEFSENTSMFGGLFVLLASWGLGGNLLLCALLYLNSLWTLVNRGLMAISLMGIFQSILCLLPVGISGIKSAWNFGDVWCSAYPFLFRFSQMSLMYLIALLLVYNIVSLKTYKPTDTLLKSSFWLPILIFILPYVVFLPPALVFLSSDVGTSIQEDRENLYACTVVLSEESELLSSYRSFRAAETVFGFLLPYLTVMALFCYLIALIRQRKGNKARVQDMYEGKTSVDVLSERDSEVTPRQVDFEGTSTREEVTSPTYTVESLAVRSDKQTEGVIYMMVVIFILSFAPYLYQTIRELADPSYTTKGDGTLRFIVHFLSYLVVLVNPTIYTLQYPTIKESLMKRELLKCKR